jgi:hypothetical protein
MARRAPFWKTYLVVALAAGLGAYTYFVESKRPAQDAKEKALELDKAKVERLTLTRVGREPLQLVRDGEQFRLEAPFRAPADRSQVDTLLGSLESLEIEAVVVDETSAVDLAQYGLEPPKTTVEVKVAGATEPIRLMLGDTAPAGGGIYARLPTRPRVFTIASYLESSFDKQAFDLRDRNVLHVDRDAVKTLEISGPEGQYALAKEAGDEWSFTKPLRTRAGRWTVDGLIGTLERLKMDEIAAEEASDQDLVRFGLDRPARTVVLGLGDAGSQTLEIGTGSAEGKVHARAAGSRLVGVVADSAVTELAKGMDALRARRLLEVATYEVTGLDVESGGTKRSYDREAKDDDLDGASKWTRTPQGGEVSSETIQDALFKIGGVEADSFIDVPGPLAEYGLETPALRLSLRYEGDKPVQWIEIGRKDSILYGRRLGDDSILNLRAKEAEELIEAIAALEKPAAKE